ncbi:SAM-dependent methyltransferase [Chitinimonas sp.]|uniref:SAM-dependent methyltransferase n=1 Tax=Chitinimonas sp. TaxID=1934313 RepID=UPI002F92E0D4
MRPAPLALGIQLLAAAVATGLTMLMSWPALVWLVCQAGLALALAIWAGQPRWWWLIHLLFAPALAFALWLAIPPWLYLVAFVLTWLVFGRIDQSRVPLYLSNQAALDALNKLVPAQSRLLDVGAGTGTVLARLARRADLNVSGVEHAWLPWLLAWLRLKLSGSPARLIRGDLMAVSLADYDVVYAFLSPAAMPALWTKAKQEMHPGGLLISNSFAVPGIVADEVFELHDWKGGKLYIWRMP